MAEKFPAPDPAILARREAIISGLAEIVRGEGLISDPDALRAYETDAFTAYRCPPLAAALPRTTAEVSQILKFCSAEGVKVTPRGAGTSLCGGAIPTADSIVLGLSKMTRILDINFVDRLMRVEAGVTNLTISQAVAGDNFFYAPDPSSQLACTIGGNIAMNSGGAHCLKYGVTVHNVLGVVLVLADGEIVEIGGDGFDSSGFDLMGFVVGHEGQIGVVTEAIVRLSPMAEGARPVLFGFPASLAAAACVADIIGAGLTPVAIEFMDRPAIVICEAFAKAGYPLDAEALLIVEVEGSEAEMDAQLENIVAIAQTHGASSMRRSNSAMEAAAIWKGRKSAFGATGRVADYICMDGTAPLGQLVHVLERTAEIVASYGLKVANVFHAGDGNMHPLIMYDVNDPREQEKAEQAGEDILRLCVEVGGALTGEHGVGIEKRDLMTCQFSPADLAQQLRARAVFDPQALLNPAKVFPLEGQKT